MAKFKASQQLSIGGAFFRARQGLLINVALFAFFVLGVIAITSTYVSSEHTFYWWDYITYQKWTRETATTLLESSHNGLHKAIDLFLRAWRSTARDYNDFPTLLLFPFFLAFGDSRLVYVLSIALVYLLPFALVLGAIAVKLIPSSPRIVYWSTALLTLLIPVVWAPTLRGYPDAGAALLISLAILVYLQDVKLRSWRQIALIGFLIATTALFRRHFVYDCIAFFASVILQTLIAFGVQVNQQSRQVWHNLLKRGTQIGWTVTASLIALTLLGLPFLVKVITTDFHHLYASYEVSSDKSLQYYGLAYGLIAWIVAGLGFAVGIGTRVLSRPVATFIVTFNSFLLLQWVFVLKQPNLHYNLHFTPFVVLGFAAFGWTAWSRLRKRTRTLVLGVSSLYLIFNAVIGLAPVDLLKNTPIHPTRFSPSYSGMGFSGDTAFTKLSALFSAHYPPLRHPDYDEIVRLVEYLRSVAGARDPIYIAASSELFNDSIVVSADTVIADDRPLPQQEQLNVLPSPTTDSGDFYPLENLFQAQYVVVASPFQHHLRVEEQDVVRVVVDAFSENWEIAQDFTHLPVEFALTNGAVVSVYQRSRSTSRETAQRTLIAMQNYIGARPGGQQDWISLSELPSHKINQSPIRGNYFLQTSNPQGPVTSFLYIGTLPEHVRITGKLRHTDNSCASASLHFDTIDTQGEVINTVELLHHPLDAPKFTLPLQTQNAAYLHFNIFANSGKDASHPCEVSIKPLSIQE